MSPVSALGSSRRRTSSAIEEADGANGSSIASDHTDSDTTELDELRDGSGPEKTSDDRRWLILGVLSLSVFLIIVDNSIVNITLPTLVRELGATTSQLQWIVDAYTLVFASLLLAGGSIGDRYGRARAMRIGLVLFGILSAVGAFSTTPGQLIAARAAMGVGAALIFPATLAILVNVFTDPKERPRAVGIWAAVSGLSVAVGPVVGGWLLEHF